LPDPAGPSMAIIFPLKADSLIDTAIAAGKYNRKSRKIKREK